MDSIASFLGLAKKAGKIAVGEEPVGAACRAHKAAVILLASDAASNTIRRAAHFGSSGGKVLQLRLPLDKEQLGGAVGRNVCAMVALTDVGMASALAQKLVDLNPDTYGPASAQLRDRSARVLARQKEKRAHEKKLLRKNVKPWALQMEAKKEKKK